MKVVNNASGPIDITEPVTVARESRGAGRTRGHPMKVVTNPKTLETSSEPVTVAYATRGSIKFTTAAGVPMSRAFDDLTFLLSSAIAAAEAVATHDQERGEPSGAWSTVHTLELAYAWVHGMHNGYSEHRKQIQA